MNNKREAARKLARKRENIPVIRRLKQQLYFERTGRWESDPAKLHWHHRDPTKKYRHVSHLMQRSVHTIFAELEKCEVLDAQEHCSLHARNQKYPAEKNSHGGR